MISLSLFLFSIFPWVKKIWVLKLFQSKKILDQKKISVQKNLGPNENFGYKNNFGPQKVFGSKKFLVLKKFLNPKKYWVKNILGTKIFVLKNFGPKIVLSQKYLKKVLGQKKIGSEKIFV